LIVEREREIRAFKADEYWEIVVELNPDSAAAASAAGEALAKLIASADPEKGLAKQELYAFCQQHRLLVADLVEFNGAKFRPNNQADAMSAVDALTKAAYHVAAIRTTQRQDKPSGPFTTASLQQAAVNQLHFTASQTMRLAQQLYEGVDLENEGRVGLITYMRTDSLNLAPEAISAAREFVTSKFGADFVPESVNRYSSAAGAQEAHEAVRPTDVTRTPDSLRGELPPPMWRLYDLIWRRFVACQMSPARWEILTVDVQADCPDNRTGLLRASARKLLFEGFLAVAGRRDSAEATLPDGVAEKAPLWPARVDPSQHFTEPPPRYTEASLVKALEAEGIGRPSTYAAIIDTIQNRGYVEQKDRRFFPLPIGEVVCDQLVAAFPKIFDVEFTRFMESELDRIENAHANWVTILREFYEPFSVCLAKAGDIITKPIEPSPYKCPKCAKDLVYRIGRTGRFIGCTGYPDCDYTANVDAEGKPVEPKEINAKCPECGKAMVLRASKRGPFLGCSSYPECTGTLPCDEAGNPLNVVEPESITATCPDCGQPMAVRFARGRAFLGCTAYPQCKATAQLPPGVTVRVPKSKAIETGILCEKCERPMVVRVSRRGPFLACTGFPRCRNARNLTEAERIAVEAGQRLEGPAKAPNAEAEETTSQPASTSESAPVAKGAKRKTKGKRASGSAPDASATASSPDATASDPSTEKTADAAVPANVPPGDLADLIKAGCPICHSPVTLRTSRFGPFLGCSNYPKCKTIVKIKGDAIKQARVALGLPEKAAARPKPAVTDIPCSKCGAMMVIRNGSSGQFLGCSTYPKCRHTSPLPVELTRPAEQR
jgi:DNA topoisomerase-1